MSVGRINENDGTLQSHSDILPGAPNSPPVAAAGGCPHALLVVLLVVVALLLFHPPPPRGGGFVGAGVDAAGGVDGATPPPPKALGWPVPNTVVVLLPQVTINLNVNVASTSDASPPLFGANPRRQITVLMYYHCLRAMMYPLWNCSNIAYPSDTCELNR